MLEYSKNEEFIETIPTTEGNITLNLDDHEIAILKFSMTISHCDHFSNDRFIIQNYRIDYKIKIDNSGNWIFKGSGWLERFYKLLWFPFSKK